MAMVKLSGRVAVCCWQHQSCSGCAIVGHGNGGAVGCLWFVGFDKSDGNEIFSFAAGCFFYDA
jgi:hypothetical protein